jgi:hypothetical protein
MALERTVTTVYSGTLDDLILYLEKLAKDTRKVPTGTSKEDKAHAGFRADGIDQAAEVLRNWTPTIEAGGNGEAPAFGGNQPGPPAETDLKPREPWE